MSGYAGRDSLLTLLICRGVDWLAVWLDAGKSKRFIKLHRKSMLHVNKLTEFPRMDIYKYKACANLCNQNSTSLAILHDLLPRTTPWASSHGKMMDTPSHPPTNPAAPAPVDGDAWKNQNHAHRAALCLRAASEPAMHGLQNEHNEVYHSHAAQDLSPP